MAHSLRKKKTTIPPIYGLNGIAHSQEDKMEVFADRLELQISPNFANCDLDFIERVERFVKRTINIQDNLVARLTTTTETGLRNGELESMQQRALQLCLRSAASNQTPAEAGIDYEPDTVNKHKRPKLVLKG
ncbi:hypothetical protein CBL_05060 [Carabus blaptoides fortunei]